MSTHAEAGPRSSAVTAVTAALGAAVAVAVVVLAFLWPVATAAPKDVPIGISGPVELVSQVEAVLAAQDPAPFELVEVSGRDDAVAQIEQRELYGAILLGESPEVLVATAGSPAVAQALRAVASQLQIQADAAVLDGVSTQLAGLAAALQAGQVPELPETMTSGEGISAPTVTVTDVVPLAEGDTTGSGLTAAAFPLVLGGILGGVLLAFLVRGAVARLVGLLVFGAAAGAVIMLVLQTWFGVLGGTWLLNATVAGVSVMATASVVVGLAALLGTAGLGLGVVLTLLVANPISSAATPPEFLAGSWGEIGQAFVPGAAVNLLRSVAYFPAAATGAQWLTILAWLAGGVLLVLIGRAKVALPQHAGR